MRIDVLCSGSKGNSCLVRDGKTQLLIDCGSTKKYLKKSFDDLQVNVDDCQGVLITHEHSDHIKQIKMVQHLPVYSYCDLDVENHHQVSPLEEFDIGSFHVQAIGLSHDAPNTIGFVIQSQQEKLVYITDTGYIPNHEKEFLTNADYYVFESNHDPDLLMKTSRPMYVKRRILGDSGHLNNEDASYLLSQFVNERTKNIALAHLSQEANVHQLALDTLEERFKKEQIYSSKIKFHALEQFAIHTIGNLE